MAAKKRKYQCVKYGRKKEIQRLGPAKTRKVCKKRVPFNSAEGRAYRKKHGKLRFCVYKGKKKVAESCHLKKSAANKAAARLKKRCKGAVKVKSKAA